MSHKLLVRINVVGTAVLLLASFAFGQAHHKRGSGITAARATQIALHRYKGKVIGKVALENEDGKMQYSVNIRSGHTLREVMVDSHTGKVASVEVTTAQEEAREAASEKRRAKRRK